MYYDPNMRLNQLLAILSGIQAKGMQALTESYHDGQHATQLDGFRRKYTPDNDDGEAFPDETKVLQTRMREVIKGARDDIAKMVQCAAQRDAANVSAKADVVVDGEVLLENVPATQLLWLEKQLLTHLKTFASKLPVVPSTETWHWDDNTGCFVSEPVQTIKSKKNPKVITKAPATEQHPAQAELIYEDCRVGLWTATKFSGALSRQEVQGIQDRVQKLLEAVVVARERANSVEVPTLPDYGTKVLGFIFG